MVRKSIFSLTLIAVLIMGVECRGRGKQPEQPPQGGSGPMGAPNVNQNGSTLVWNDLTQQWEMVNLGTGHLNVGPSAESIAALNEATFTSNRFLGRPRGSRNKRKDAEPATGTMHTQGWESNQGIQLGWTRTQPGGSQQPLTAESVVAAGAASVSDRSKPGRRKVLGRPPGRKNKIPRSFVMDSTDEQNWKLIDEGQAHAQVQAQEAQARAMAWAQAFADPQPNSQPQAQPQAQPRAWAHAQPQAQPRAWAHAQPQTQSQAWAHAQAQAQSPARAHAQPQAQPQAWAHAQAQAQPPAWAHAQPQTQSQSQAWGQQNPAQFDLNQPGESETFMTAPVSSAVQNVGLSNENERGTRENRVRTSRTLPPSGSGNADEDEELVRLKL